MFAALGNLVPGPLHPAVVHLPIALAMLSPLVAGATLFAIHRGARPLRAWGITVAMLAALSVSAWVWLATGVAEADKAGTVVATPATDTHADAVQGFLILSLIVLGVGAVGFVKGPVGGAARVVATSGTLALVISGYRAGRAEGELVDRYGAPNAFAVAPAARAAGVSLVIALREE